MKFICSFSLFVLICFSSCGGDENALTGEENIQIRIENMSAFTFMDVKMLSFDEELEYGDLDGQELSEYKVVQRAYSYAYIELIIDGDTYILQPIDFTGEEELSNGKYTYQIDANDSSETYDKLSLTFKED